MERCDESEIDEKEDCPFTGMIKNVNDNQRENQVIDKEITFLNGLMKEDI